MTGVNLTQKQPPPPSTPTRMDILTVLKALFRGQCLRLKQRLESSFSQFFSGYFVVFVVYFNFLKQLLTVSNIIHKTVKCVHLV